MTGHYGESPVSLGSFTPEWNEFMHYLYLPVRLPLSDGGTKAQDDATLPDRLEFLRDSVYAAIDDATALAPHFGNDPYVYVTARRGFATPGNPLNRTGWHCDDFGGTDLNYIWTDNFPTRFLVSENPLDISTDDAQSMLDMQGWADLVAFGARSDSFDTYSQRFDSTRGPIHIKPGTTNTLIRLSPWVVHDTPIIEEPGGMRSFFKISVSTHRYDLVGNSHNYLFDYNWPMVDRASLRNQPSDSNHDYSKLTTP